MAARHPAAWINTIAESRDFNEAIYYLQQAWDELQDCRQRLAEYENKEAANANSSSDGRQELPRP